VSTTPQSAILSRLTKHRKKLRNKSEKSTNLESLAAYLKVNNLSEADAIDRLQLQDFDPAKDFYGTLVSASKQLMSSVKDKTLDLDDSYQKGLFQLLQAGDKINKSLKLAKLEAYPEEDTAEESVSFMDRVSGKK
jgi:hypothetical protein